MGHLEVDDVLSKAQQYREKAEVELHSRWAQLLQLDKMVNSALALSRFAKRHAELTAGFAGGVLAGCKLG